jgi:hydrogenase 3 maturation protease
MQRVLVVGIGNEMRGDDGAGVMLARKLDSTPDLETLDVGTVPESFTGKMREVGADLILLVDAVDFGGEPGSVGVFDAEQIPARWCTTHHAPLSILMDFLKQETGSEVLLLGIQPKEIRQNAPPSQEVEASVAALAELMNKQVFSAIETLRARR